MNHNCHINLISKKVQMLESFIEIKGQLRASAELKYLFWEATLRCNLECLHCGSDCIRDNSSIDKEIFPDMIKQQLTQIAEYYSPRQITFAIIGGEPLIREDILEVGAFAASLGYWWGITTNGMLLDKEMIVRLKDSGLKTISVSLDGLAEKHDQLRQKPGSHRIVVEAIKRLLQDPFYGAFDVICCISKLNIHQLQEIVEMLCGLGVPAVRFVPIFSRGRASRNDYLMLDNRDYLTLLNFLAEQREKRTDIRLNLGEEGYWGPEWECRVRDDFHYCSSGIQTGSILYNGDVIGCPSVSRKFIEGNISQTPFVEIWRTKFSRYRQGKKKLFAPFCGSCEHWDLCEGGGFHLLDQQNIKNDFCCLRKISETGVADER